MTHVFPGGQAQEGVQHAAQHSAGGGGGAMRRQTGGRALGGVPVWSSKRFAELGAEGWARAAHVINIH